MTTPHSSTSDIQSTLQEQRLFQPPDAKSLGFDRWHVGSLDEYRALHKRSIWDPEGFWAEESHHISWFKPFTHVLEWHAPDAKWFVGGQTNACYNCVDRHVQAGHGDETAIVWEGEPVAPRTSHPAAGSAYASEPEVRRVTYRELLIETSKLGFICPRNAK